MEDQIESELITELFYWPTYPQTLNNTQW